MSGKRSPVQRRSLTIRSIRFPLDGLTAVGNLLAVAQHDHDHDGGSTLSEMDLRVRALERILVEKGYLETATLERMVAEKGVTTAQALADYHDAWERPAHRTPHGTPIEMKAEDFRRNSNLVPPILQGRDRARIETHRAPGQTRMTRGNGVFRSRKVTLSLFTQR